MSHLDLTGCKKRKRGERVFRFKSFGEKGYPVEFLGPFRKNVKALLEFGHLESDLCPRMPSWSFQLEVHRHPPVHVLLFIIEESIDISVNRHCKQCQFVGWGQHLICNKKYHFVLPSKDTMVEACMNYKEGNDHVVADSGNFGKSKILVESRGHIMHGVFHSNGFGHLLCVNGLENGSDLAGHHIIDFWDRLCNGLRVRKVSLNDTSRKKGMELRLIHGIAYGEPWFGRWGYKFGRGTFCVTQQMYQRALEALSGMPLTLLIHNFLYPPNNQDLSLIFSKYQALSDHSLTTLGDLFHFMLELKSRLPKDTSNMESCNPGILVETTCRWSPKRVEMATRVIVEFLKRAQFRWVSRQEVRDAARNYIGDTGLLDFVLKSLGNQIVGNYLVRRSLNPVTKVLEYCLEDVSNHVFINNNSNHEGNNLVVNGSRMRAMYKITRFQLMKDVFYLYKCVLKENVKMNSGVLSAISVAVRIVLDSKYLVKEYSPEIPAKFEMSSSRSHCSIDSSGKFICATRDCGSGMVECKGAGAIPPTTLVEFTLAATNSGQDFYDVSLVGGFNLPVSMTPGEGSSSSFGRCNSTSCPAEFQRGCPKELAVKLVGDGECRCLQKCMFGVWSATILLHR
ncbi:hypothetical protein L484_004031 [Morus notabilis]|uniref:PTC1-like winged helix-turn-helix domain-containing protein n=1 Tax=Morus notabilis TaxID=981085 RepID=W9RIN0_9ROSA|nr:hypothetical protein L484_004031 [Morus notabilis]